MSNLPIPKFKIRLDSESKKYYISAYQKGELSGRCIDMCCKLIAAAFPNLKSDFFTLLIGQAKINGFSDSKLTDAINHVIATYKYQYPTVALFMDYDKKLVEVATYSDLLKLAEIDKKTFDKYERICNNPRLYVLKVNKC